MRESARHRAAFALGLSLAGRGRLAVVAFGLALVTVVLCVLLASETTGAGEASAVDRVPNLASTVLAWGAGLSFAYAASVHALRQDGVRSLLLLRGVSRERYGLGRVAAIVVLVAVLVAGGTLVTGLACMYLAPTRALAARAAGQTFAGCAYALAFAVVIGPLAVATLGARSRSGGYALLLALLVLPEWAAHAVGPSVGPWAECLALPSALAALRASLGGPVDPARMLRALSALAAMSLGALVVVRIELARLTEDTP